MHTEHSGLKQMGETYKKPYDCFMNEDRYFKAAPPKSYATILMMKSDNVLVRNIGITKWGYEYRSDELCDYIGRKVDIKYDPDDMAVLYVFDQKGKRICEAYCQELLQIAPKVTQKALEEHLKMQKRQQKRDRERLEEARRPFEELNEQYVGFNEATGGIDLMIGGKKKEKAAKVIAIPTDRTYQQGFRAEKREEAEPESEYMSRQAENALKKLRAIGG